MLTNLNSFVLRNLVKFGVIPADTFLLYDPSYFFPHPGLTSYANVLYGLVRSAKPGVVVEIGSGFGYSTCILAAALQRNGSGKLYSIDPHESTQWNDTGSTSDTFSIVQQRLKRLRLSPVVEQIRKYSSEALKNWQTPVDFLFIDGDHTYEKAKADFEGFLPFVKPGGLILFHDTMWESLKDHDSYRADIGVPKVVQELQDAHYPMVTLTQPFGLTILQNSPGGYRLIP